VAKIVGSRVKLNPDCVLQVGALIFELVGERKRGKVNVKSVVVLK
jgi:hypothetical protein